MSGTNTSCTEDSQIRLSIKGTLGLFTLILIGILVFGLTPKDYNFKNNVQRIKDRTGLKFGKYGIIHTEPFILSKNGFYQEKGFSIEVALKPEISQNGGFRFIFCFHNGYDQKQFILGQWRSMIILMNGDDYSYERKSPRISFNRANYDTQEFFLTLTSDWSGTKVYVNGNLVSVYP